MAASWVTQLSMGPVLIGVGVDNDGSHTAHHRGRFVHREPLGRRGHEGVRQVLEAGR